MRIRRPFLGAFVILLFIAAYIGLAPDLLKQYQPEYYQSDKVLHFVTFFLLTLAFYWILDTSRRRAIQFTLAACTGGLSIGSEIVQAAIPNNGRNFDIWDIVGNVVGSLCGIALCAWYHERMLDRKRRSRHYRNLSTDVGDEEDVELGEGMGPQEDGVTAGSARAPTVDEELDNWDENEADEWDQEEVPPVATTANGDSRAAPPVVAAAAAATASGPGPAMEADASVLDVKKRED